MLLVAPVMPLCMNAGVPEAGGCLLNTSGPPPPIELEVGVPGTLQSSVDFLLELVLLSSIVLLRDSPLELSRPMPSFLREEVG